MARRGREAEETTENGQGESPASFVFGAPGVKKVRDRTKKTILDAKRLVQDAYTSWGESVYPDEARTTLRVRHLQSVAHSISALKMAQDKIALALAGAQAMYDANAKS